jgi:hypothetical protein
MARLRCVLGERFLGPDFEGGGTRGRVIPRCGSVTLRMEVARDKSVGLQEPLRLRRRFESLYLPLSQAGRSMQILRAIVEVAALSRLYIRQQISPCHAIACQLVDEQDVRYMLQTLKQPLEEAVRRPYVVAALH